MKGRIMRRKYGLASVLILMSLMTVAAWKSAHSYEVFTVGDLGTCFHNDGNDWHRVTGPLYDGSVNDLKVFSEDDMYLRTGGKVYHFDGASWNRFYTGTYDLYVRTMWMESDTSMFFGINDGDSAVVLHYHDGEWTESRFFTSSRLVDIHGTSASDLYAITKEEIYHFDGSSWSDPIAMGGWETITWKVVWCESSNSVWLLGAVDYASYVILHFDGSQWEEDLKVDWTYLYALWGDDEGVLYAVGNTGMVGRQGVIYSRDRNEHWHHETIFEVNNFYAIHGSSPSNIYAVGQLNDGIYVGTAYHYDGEGWVSLPEQFENILCSVYAFSSDFIVAGSTSGYIFTGDGTDWTRDIPEVTTNFKNVWGTSLDNLYAVSEDGLIYRYDGASWSEVIVTGSGYPFDKIWGLSEEEIYAIGDEGVFQFNGSDWQQIYSGPTNDIWGTSSTNIYATTIIDFLHSHLMHYDGSEWTIRVDSFGKGTSQYSFRSYCTGVWGTQEGELFVVGHYQVTDYDNQTVFYYPMIQHWDGSSWEELDAGGEYWQKDYTYDVWGSSGDYAFMVGTVDARMFDGEATTQIGDDTDGNSVWSSGLEAWWAHSEYDEGHVIYYDGIEDHIIQLNGLALHGVWGIGDESPKAIVTVMAEPMGPEFMVAGAVFTEPYVFLADVGATYELGVESPQINGEEYYFREWSDGGDTVHTIVVPDTNITYVAYFDTPVSVTVTAYPEGLDVTAGGNTYASPYIFSMLSNSELEIGTYSPQSYGGSDYCFDEWSDGGDTTHIVVVPVTDVVYTATFGDYITGDEVEPVPLANKLHQNHPNPFNPSTTISFSLCERKRASLAVYDVAGRLVRVLIDDVVDAGPRDVTWNGKDNAGRGVASGVYFYRLEAGEFIETKKMVLLR